MKNSNHIRHITTSAVIAALYVALTLLSNLFGLASGPVQFRISEALCILPIFTPAAIPGLIIGCFIANTFSFHPIDLIVGTSATAIAAIATYRYRNCRIHDIPWLSLLSPVVFNSIMVGGEIWILYMPDSPFITALITTVLSIGISEALVIVTAGAALYFALKKHSNVFR